jgi:hypothetical protein
MIKNHRIDFYHTNAYFYAMLRIRKVKTKSGSTAIQVVQYTEHIAKIIEHMGSAKDEIERDLLMSKAQEWIGKYALQSNLFPEQKQNVLIVERSECVKVTHDFEIKYSQRIYRTIPRLIS